MEVDGKLKQHQKTSGRSVTPRQQQKPTEAVSALAQPPAAADEASPSPLSKRQQRQAQRLQDFQEKKRAAAVQEFVARGYDLATAQATVARAERKRLELAAAARAVPMQAEAVGVDGRPPRRRRGCSTAVMRCHPRRAECESAVGAAGLGVGSEHWQ